MANLREVSGTYGSGKTPCTVFVMRDRGIGKWYVAEGSRNVNYTYDEIENGVDIEELHDEDMFSWSSPIESLEELEAAVED